MRNWTKIIMTLALILIALPVCSQEKEKVELEGGADIVSSYIYRGQKYGKLSIQPYIGMTWKDLYVEVWGTAAIDRNEAYRYSQDEIDLKVEYAISDFHIGVTDYYNFNCDSPYLRFGGREETAHVVEANVGYTHEWLTADWYTIIGGYDGLNSHGNRAYSSYLMLQSSWQWLQIDWNAQLGIVPYCTDYYEYDRSGGFHVNDITLSASYSIPLGSRFELPVNASAMYNPSSNDIYFILGCSYVIQ